MNFSYPVWLRRVNYLFCFICTDPFKRFGMLTLSNVERKTNEISVTTTHQYLRFRSSFGGPMRIKSIKHLNFVCPKSKLGPSN